MRRRCLDVTYWVILAMMQPSYQRELTPSEASFIEDNSRKHRLVLWFDLVTIALVAFALRYETPETVSLVINLLIAPAMVTGGAWFAISFGGIPERLLNVAMSVAFFMFLAFTCSLTTMFLAVLTVVPALAWPVLAFIYLGLIVSCVQYDTADGLKVGLDDAVLRHSRIHTRYLIKQGAEEVD